MADFNKAVEVVFSKEGGFVNDPRDPGGATNWGISLRFLHDPEVDGDFDGDGDEDVEDVRNMTRDQAITLYKKWFWDKLKLDNIKNQDIATKVFDLAVNIGRVAAVKVLQNAINDGMYVGSAVLVDGMMGPTTTYATNIASWPLLERNLRLHAIKYYASIPPAKSQPYLRGWILRALA